MVKDLTTIGLSRDLIIHPGETLDEIIKDREMSQKELAIRTGVTEKHINTVIKACKPISVAFAKKLEYALGIDSSFWINLQSNYDRELLEFSELNQISQEESKILKPLKAIVDYMEAIGIIDKNTNDQNRILHLRKILAVSNLSAIPDITYNAAYRAQIASNVNVDVYVLFAWQRLCEILTSQITIKDQLDTGKLLAKVPEIKKLMFLSAELIEEALTEIFAECGIAFRIVKHFTGAPVHGFIKISDNDRMILCMTIRKGSADVFWFTLFHEIGHIINGDIKQKFIDFDTVKNEIEQKADLFANKILINFDDYRTFVKNNDFTLNSIRKFAKTQNVQSYIVIGRLQHDNLLEWNKFAGEKEIYAWTSEE